MKQLSGQIIALQEERIRLVTPDGRGALLTLANWARVRGSLQALHRQQVLVVVDYTGEPNLASGIARRIRPAARLRLPQLTTGPSLELNTGASTW